MCPIYRPISHNIKTTCQILYRSPIQLWPIETWTPQDLYLSFKSCKLRGWLSLHGSDLFVQHHPQMLDWIEIWGIWRQSQRNDEPVVVVLWSWESMTLVAIHQLSFLTDADRDTQRDLESWRPSRLPVTSAHLSGFHHIIFEDVMFNCCLIFPTHWQVPLIINC